MEQVAQQTSSGPTSNREAAAKTVGKLQFLIRIFKKQLNPACVSNLWLYGLLLKDLLFDILAEAEGGGGAVVPHGTQAVMRRSGEPPRHQQLHINAAVGHQELAGFSLQSKKVNPDDVR